MVHRLKARATPADLEDLPENLVGEIIDGELHLSPRPAIPHAQAASALGIELGGPFGLGRGGPGGWWILDEPELRFHENVLVPDLAGWRRERLPKLPDAPIIELAPDWVCEVVSPGTARLDRVKKLPIYARENVAHAWIIDPATRVLEVFALDGDGWRLVSSHAGDDLVRAPPFEAVEIELLPSWGEVRSNA